MARLLIHDPKRVVDLIQLSFDFSADLVAGETIAMAVATATVYTGADPSPETVIYQLTQITGSLCKQGMWKGLSGVVYDVLMTVVTSTDRTIEQVVRVAIRPDDTHGQGLYIPLFYTSRPYPYYIPDQFIGHTILAAGALRTVQAYYNFDDQFTGHAVLVSGNLRSSIITYTVPPDAIQGSTVLTAGVLRQVIITYPDVPESFVGTTVLRSGTLAIGRVEYSNPPEVFIGTTILILGTLGS